MGGGFPAASVVLILALYSIGAHGIMTLNDFKAGRTAIAHGRSIAAGHARRRPSGTAGLRGDGQSRKVAVIALLAIWMHHAVRGGRRRPAGRATRVDAHLLRDPLGNTPWYNATGTTLYVLGMLAPRSDLAACGRCRRPGSDRAARLARYRPPGTRVQSAIGAIVDAGDSLLNA